MSDSILPLLAILYGESAAQELLPEINALMQKYAAHNSAPNVRVLDQRDALLITYGDQVRADDEHPLGALTKFLDAHVRELISGVHVLPFYPYSSDDGFSVIDYYAVDHKLGTWSDIARLAQHFDLMFDAVINHISAQSAWFQEFLRGDPAYRDFFIVVEGNPDLSRVVRPALPLLTQVDTAAGGKKVWTTFSADQIDLKYANPNVLLQILDVLLFYVAHGARFIRLDAIAYLWKEIGTASIHLRQTHAVIQLMRAVLDEVAPGVMLITETNVPHTDNISYFGDGTNEAQLVYNFALPPLVMHTLLTGNATALTHWARTLELSSNRVTFFNFLASHDGIGLNPARGILADAEIDALVTRTLEHNGLVSYKHNVDGSTSPYELNISYFDALTNPNDAQEPTATQVRRFLCAQAIMLSLRGIPGIYFHSLFGSRNDRAGANRSGIARRINRQKFERAELERALDDPHSIRAQVFTRYADLLRARRAEPAFNPYSAQRVLELDARVFAILRGEAESQVVCLHNARNGTVILEWTGAERGTNWKNLFNGETFAVNEAGVLQIELGPYQIAWLKSLTTND